MMKNDNCEKGEANTVRFKRRKKKKGGCDVKTKGNII